MKQVKVYELKLVYDKEKRKHVLHGKELKGQKRLAALRQQKHNDML